MQKKFIVMIALFYSLCWGVPCHAGEEEYPYYVAVNLALNIVTVYSMDEEGNYTVPDRAFTCSVGEGTPTGTFCTSDKYVWRPLFGNVYGQYATRITGHILFHSVPYSKQDKRTLEYEEYNKLGEAASMGCIRLTVEDAKWIYDNCPSGTTVEIYSSDEPEPLEPPEPYQIDTNDPRKTWDPTDPDKNNPWKKEMTIEMSMKSGEIIRKVEVLYQDENYALTADDAEIVFGHLGLTLVLPKNTEALQTQGKLEILFQRQRQEVSYVKYNGKVFFSLKDLGEITGTNVSSDNTFGQITLNYIGTTGENQVKLLP